MLGTFFWPHSVYGVGVVSRFAWVPDMWLMSVEDIVLALFIIRKQGDMLRDARKQATLDASRLALEREVAERQRTERLLSLQYVITRVLASANSLTEGAPVILRIMGENQGWQVGELWEVDESRQYMRCVDIWHTDELRQLGLHRPAPGPAHRARRRPGRARLAAAPPALDPRPRRGADAAAGDAGEGYRGCTARSRSRCATGPEVIGVMAFFSSEVRQANDDHLSMLSALGGQIGQFMERKRMEQGLRDSEERYRSVIAALDEGIVLVDSGGRLLATNASAERILARASIELLGSPGADPFASVVDEDERMVAAVDLPFLVTLRTGEPRQNRVLGVTRKDGSRVWISMNSQPLVHFGETRALRGDGVVHATSPRARRPRSRCAPTHADLENRVEKRTSPADGGQRAHAPRGRRARARPARDALGQGRGRHRQPGQERLPRQHEPRAAHAAQRGHRVLGAARAGDLRRAQHQAARRT